MKNIIYWYSDGEYVYPTKIQPNISHVIQKISTIGIPECKAVQYNYKNKIYNTILKNEELNNKIIIERIVAGDV